jgi:hypothetical protein
MNCTMNNTLIQNHKNTGFSLCYLWLFIDEKWTKCDHSICRLLVSNQPSIRLYKFARGCQLGSDGICWHFGATEASRLLIADNLAVTDDVTVKRVKQFHSQWF